MSNLHRTRVAAKTAVIPTRTKRGVVRPIRVEDDVAYITLSGGVEAIIDAADVPVVQQWSWHALAKPHTTYARATVRVNGVSRKFRMHRVIVGANEGCIVDHINGNGLDNRRINLRIVSEAENSRNRRARRNGLVPNVRVSRAGRYECWVRIGTFGSRREAEEAVVSAEVLLGRSQK